MIHLVYGGQEIDQVHHRITITRGRQEWSPGATRFVETIFGLHDVLFARTWDVAWDSGKHRRASALSDVLLAHPQRQPPHPHPQLHL